MPSPVSLAAEAAPGLHTAWVLFSAIALVLAAFLAVVALMMLARRRRRERVGPPSRRLAGVDPWAEAGRRAKGFPDRRKRS